jgi:mannose-6-phosphate isomerase
VLGKDLPPGDHVAESWEIVDRGPDQSVVDQGPLAGTTLHELVTQRGPELLGRHEPQPQFPLLLKFLDAQRDLSVQVHPSDEQAGRLTPPDLGKTEAWVVLHTEPGSQIYAGLKRGFDRHAVEREMTRGTLPLCLHRFEPQVGDCVFVPAGTVHALGAGLLVCELQQASDTTFRLFDWNRVDDQGRPRPLHIEQGLAAIDFESGPRQPQRPRPTDRPHVRQWVACDKFVLDRWDLTQHATLGGDDRFHILVALEGRLRVDGSLLSAGESMLLPAALGACHVTPEPHVRLLDAYLP